MKILVPNGHFMTAIQADKRRLNASGLHILRGLYFRETGKRLSIATSEVRVDCKAGLTAEHPDMLTFARVFHLLPDQRNGATGTAFSYAAAFGHGSSIWLMLLYDYFFWIGSVDERDEDQRALDDHTLESPLAESTA